MSQTTQQLQLLNLIPRPAFYGKGGVITAANQSAQAMLLTPGTSIEPLLLCGDHALEELKQGSLCTALLWGGSRIQVAITPCPEGFFFLLDSQEDIESLQLLALAARQLRRPLHELMLAAESGLADDSDPGGEHESRLMYRNMLQILRIVGNMSDAQLYHSGTFLCKERVELGSFYDEIFQKTAQLTESLGIMISLELPRRDVVAWADRQQLERCVLNLLSNALRFTPRGGTIRGRLQVVGSQGVLRIADSGEGLHEQVRAALFDRYRREPSLEDDRYGIGLGLLLCRLVATNHGGALFLGPGRDGGTEAVLSVSLKDPEACQMKVNSPLCAVDYAGGWDHVLVELSGELPPEAMDYL